MNKPKVWGAFLLLALVWGSSFLFIKIALDDLAPFTLVAMRVTIGSVGLWAVIGLTRTSLPKDISTLLGLGIVGIFNTAIPFVLITWGEQFIDSGLASILNGTVPLFSLVVAHFALSDERITWLRLAGLIVGFLGLLLIFSEDLLASLAQAGQGNSIGSVRGQLAVVVAAICYAFAGVYNRRKLRHVQPLVIAGGSQLVAMVAVGISAFLLEAPLASQLSGRTWFAIVWLGLLGVALAFTLYYYIISQWGATRAALTTYAMPIVAVILGALVLGEVLKWQVAVGGTFILSGIALVNRRPAQPSVATANPATEAAS